MSPVQAVKQSTAITQDRGYSAEQLQLIKRTLVDQSVSDSEFALFIEVCKRTSLDPFRKQVYAIKRGGRLTIQTSIDGFRVLAQRSGKYAGQLGPFWCGADGNWVDVWLDSKPPMAAKVGILRTDFREPLWGVAKFSSYAAENLWKKLPEVMIAKCAEALAIRRAFPEDVSGLYTEEEMQQDDVVVEGPAQQQQPRAKALADRVRPKKAAGARWLQHSDALNDATTLDELKVAWTAVTTDVKAGAITMQEATELTSRKDEAKARIVGDEQEDLPEAWGGPPERSEPPDGAKP